MTETLLYEVRRVRTKGEMDAALELRHEVFCEEQGVPKHEEIDGRDHEALHLVAVGEGELLATCRLLFVGPTGRAPARRRGIATALLELAAAEPRAAGARRLVLHAQTYAQQLYEAAGYESRGRVFIEADIEHVAMERQL